MTLSLVQMSFKRHLQQMAKDLPDGYRLTLIARHTTRPDSDIIMTSDDLGEVACAVLALAKSEPQRAV